MPEDNSGNEAHVTIQRNVIPYTVNTVRSACQSGKVFNFELDIVLTMANCYEKV